MSSVPGGGARTQVPALQACQDWHRVGVDQSRQLSESNWPQVRKAAWPGTHSTWFAVQSSAQADWQAPATHAAPPEQVAAPPYSRQGSLS
ncbi:MAG: hypothetical protein QM765_33260 [Myxococcales bacterium]